MALLLTLLLCLGPELAASATSGADGIEAHAPSQSLLTAGSAHARQVTRAVRGPEGVLRLDVPVTTRRPAQPIPMIRTRWAAPAAGPHVVLALDRSAPDSSEDH